MIGTSDYIWLVINLLVLISNAVLNGVLIVAVCSNRLLLQRRYAILISLAVADLLKIIPMISQMITVFVGPEESTGINACLVLSATGLLLIITTILHLVYESVNRLMAIIRPLRYNTLLTHRIFSLLFIIIWILPILATILPVFIHRHPHQWDGSLRVIMFSCEVNRPVNESALNLPGNGKKDDDSHKLYLVVYAAVNTVLFFVIPLIIMVISYSRIFKISLQHIRQIRKLETGMKRLKHKYSCQRAPSIFDSQIFNASSIVSTEENIIAKVQKASMPRRKKNSIVPLTQEGLSILNQDATMANESSGGNQILIIKNDDAKATRMRENIEVFTGTEILDETSSIGNALEIFRQDIADSSESMRHDSYYNRRFENTRKSEDSGHGTISQISNIINENNKSNENIKREGSSTSVNKKQDVPIGLVISNEQPFYNLVVNDSTTAYDEDISTIQIDNETERPETTLKDQGQDDANVNMSDLFNLLAGFSVMEAWAESVKAKSNTPQNSFARLHAVIKDELRNKRKEIKLIKTLGGLMAAWIIFYVPILVFSWIRLYRWPARHESDEEIGRFLLSWALLNSTLNPIIYCLRIAEFRESVNKVVLGIKDFLFCY